MGNKYKVTGISRRTIMLPNGTFKDVYEVSFETQSGVKDSITVPTELFSKDYVKTELDKAVNNIEGVMSL